MKTRLMSGMQLRQSRRAAVELTVVGTSGSSARGALVCPRREVRVSSVPVLMRAEENAGLNNCFFEKKDWRACKDEVSSLEKAKTYLLSANAYRVHKKSGS